MAHAFCLFELLGKLRFHSLRWRLIHWTDSCILRTADFLGLCEFCAVACVQLGEVLNMEHPLWVGGLQVCVKVGEIIWRLTNVRA